MYNMLKVERYKLKKFWLGYGAMLFMFAIGYLYGDNRIGNKVFDQTDDTLTAFTNVVSDTSFVFLIAIAAALFIGKDFSNRTICNEIKLGYSRIQIVFSRMIIVSLLAILLHAIYITATIIGFSVVRGFDTSLLLTENVYWLLTVFLQLTAITSGVVLISFLTKKVTDAIALSALLVVICCNVLRNFFSSRLYTLSCFNFVQNNSFDDLLFAAISALITIMLFLTIAIFTFQKAEIK